MSAKRSRPATAGASQIQAEPNAVTKCQVWQGGKRRSEANQPELSAKLTWGVGRQTQERAGVRQTQK